MMSSKQRSLNWGGSSKKVFLRTFPILFILLVLAVSRPTSTSTASAKVQSVLVNLAAEEPDSLVSVIVQKTGEDDSVYTLAENLGGTVTKELHILNAFAAQIPAGAVMQLAQSPDVNWISFDGPVLKANDSGSTNTYSLLADFNEPTFDDGVSTSWTEIGEDDGPQSGDVAIVNFLGGALTGLRIQNAQKGVQSQFDLTAAENAVLSFGYRRKNFENETEFVALEISNDNGVSWTELDRLVGPITDPNLMFANYDLTPFINSPFTLRFVSSASLPTDGKFYIDYIKIEYQADISIQQANESTATTSLPDFIVIEDPTIGDIPKLYASVPITNTMRDEFSSVSYENNDGTVDWKSDWIENDPYGSNGASGGYVYVRRDQLVFHYAYANDENIKRQANLSGSTQATLSFDWQTSHLDNGETISVQISLDGVNFTELAAFGGSQSGTAEYDISPYISENTTVWFGNQSTNWEIYEYATFDNVQITYTCPECIDTSHLNNTYVQAIGADQVWNEAPYFQGRAVTVAVVDSGIAEHIDLTDATGKSRIIKHVQFMTDNSSPDDLYGHGTHVAGSIAGNGLLSGGVYMGIAPKADLVDVKVIDDHGAGYTSDVVAGIQWIYENHEEYNIRVVNLSLNSAVVDSYHESPLDAALEILWFNGITVVVSAGNNGTGPDGYLYAPANDPFFITVGATDDKGSVSKSDDTLAPFSAHGYTQGGFAKPDILAPGTDIVSLLASDDSNLILEHPNHAVTGPDGNIYFRMSGTSMSSGVVSGAVALLLEDEPELTPDQVKYRLRATGSTFATPLPGPTSVAYLDIPAAINGTTTASSNTGIQASELLWSGSDPINWGSVNWGSVNWGSVNWGSVNWGSVNWGSVNWGS